MIIPDLPCTKCILLAICKSKRHIKCDILFNLMNEAHNTTSAYFQIIQEQIGDMFPNGTNVECTNKIALFKYIINPYKTIYNKRKGIKNDIK